MIISFDRKHTKKPADVTSTHSKDAYQIFDEIEKEMDRIYQEICDSHEKKNEDKKEDTKKQFKRKDMTSFVKGEVNNEVHEMRKIAGKINQIGRKIGEEKVKIQ